MPMLVPHFGLDLALTCPVIVDEMQGLMHFWKAHPSNIAGLLLLYES